MKPERIEELARLAYEAAAPGNLWEWVANHDPDAKAMWLAATRTLYAAAMRDAAGVARDFEHAYRREVELAHNEERRLSHDISADTAGDIAERIEAIAKEAESDNG